MVITTTPTSTGELYTSGRVSGYEKLSSNSDRVFGYNSALGGFLNKTELHSERCVQGVGWAASRIAEDRSPGFSSYPATALPDPGAVLQYYSGVSEPTMFALLVGAKHLHSLEQAERGGVPIIPGSPDMRLHTSFFAEWQDL